MKKSIISQLMVTGIIGAFLFLVGCSLENKVTPVVETTAPTILSTLPVDLATAVSVNSSIAVDFSESMDPLSISGTSFTLMNGTTPVTGVVAYYGMIATFNPDADFTYNTLYTATLSVGVKDLVGNALAEPKVWSFTTGSAPDVTAPIIASILPAVSATDVAVNNNISATLSENMDPSTINSGTFILKAGDVVIPGVVSFNGTVVTFNPDADLEFNTLYTAKLTTGIKDLANNALANDLIWTFTTGNAADTTAPEVVLSAPLNAAVDVAINSSITATFSEAMDPASLTTLSFKLATGSTSVVGVVSYAGGIATFLPSSDLASSTVYTATVTTAVKDLANNLMGSDVTWSFTTGVARDVTAPTVEATSPVNSAVDVAINGNLTTTFNEAMKPTTITTTTFTLKAGSTVIPGVVTYSGLTATFNPTNNLTNSTLYTATVTTGMKDLGDNALASATIWTFTTGAAPDTTAPTVISTAPADGATAVAINTNVTTTFSEAMNALSITATTYRLTTGATLVAGVYSYTGLVATFNPNADLAYDTVYTVTVTTGAKDLADNSLAVNKVWSFTTGNAPDVTAPTVSSVTPTDTATSVAINTNLTGTFSEAMNAATILEANFTLFNGTTPIPGAVTYSGLVATFNPNGDLAYNTLYTAKIKTGVKDLAGNSLAAEKVWTFTTLASTDTTAPTTGVTTPSSNATDVDGSGNLTVVFDEAMDSITINGTTFLVKKGSAAVTGNVSYNAATKTATFSLTGDLDPFSTYDVTLTTGMKDASGNALSAPVTWSFTTVAVAAGPLPIVLGGAGNFVILAKSAISTVPTSVITGDIGLSPAAETFITGFSQTDATGYATSAQVTGKIYAATMAPPTPGNMTTAISDMEAAYTDGATRPFPVATNLGAGSLGGSTITPGLYKWTSDVNIATALTLAGGGGPDDVWIFQISGNLDLSSAIGVVLSGGAQAKNIYWVVAGSVFLGTTSHFEGTILSQTSITMATNASIKGRMLAQTMVALDQNTVTAP